MLLGFHLLAAGLVCLRFVERRLLTIGAAAYRPTPSSPRSTDSAIAL